MATEYSSVKEPRPAPRPKEGVWKPTGDALGGDVAYYPIIDRGTYQFRLCEGIRDFFTPDAVARSSENGINDER